MLENEIKVSLQYVTKEFDLYKRKADKIKSFYPIWRKKNPTFWALCGISLEIKKGESVGIIGLNGSGKSTLLNVIAGIVPATTGCVQINGDSSILAIGAGFKTALTGRENIKMRLMMLGKDDSYIEKALPEIIEFADIGDFIDQPLKHYSSGMKARLGFSIEVHSQPDVFIIDEALAVGDQTFSDKCKVKIEEMKTQGKTIIVVSHSIAQLQQLCDRVVWMHSGELMSVGESEVVLKEYRNFVKKYNEKNDVEKNKYQQEQKRKQQYFNLENYRNKSFIQYTKHHDLNKSSENEQFHSMFRKKNAEKMTMSMRLICTIMLIVIFCLSYVYISSVNIIIIEEKQNAILKRADSDQSLVISENLVI